MSEKTVCFGADLCTCEGNIKENERKNPAGTFIDKMDVTFTETFHMLAMNTSDMLTVHNARNTYVTLSIAKNF